jgi:hypothetical protein
MTFDSMAQYHDLLSPSSKNDVLAKARVWSYPKPTPRFKSIKDYLSFYATSNTDPRSTGSWTCVSHCRVYTDSGCLPSNRWLMMTSCKRKKVTSVSIQSLRTISY